MQGIILFAHGARDPSWAKPFLEIRDRVRARRPGTEVELAFLELMQPLLPDTVHCLASRGAMNITIFPVFMAQGGHLKKDLPRIVDELRAEIPGVTITIESAVGDVPEILESIAGWIVDKAR